MAKVLTIIIENCNQCPRCFLDDSDYDELRHYHKCALTDRYLSIDKIYESIDKECPLKDSSCG